MKECKDLTEEDVSKLNGIVSSGGSCSLVRCNYCPIAYCDWIASTSKVSVKIGSDLYCVLVEMDFTDIYERCDRAKLLLREYKLERILKK